jgi:hypothetical protein
VRFDAQPLWEYLQYADPVLLRDDPLRTVWYLHSQPPLFNAFLALVLVAFPGREAAVLQMTFLGLGLALTLSSYALMCGLGAQRRIALLVGAAATVSPVTVLFEQWLIYTLPVAVMLAASALLLLRHARRGGWPSALGFCVMLCLVTWTRGTFHPVWALAGMAGLVLCSPLSRRRAISAAILPAVLVLALPLKTLLVFGTSSCGQVYLDVNLWMMTVGRLDAAERERLVSAGTLSPISRIDVFPTPLRSYDRIVPPGPPTGISILDQEVKSSGAPNWHNRRTLQIGRRYRQDGLAALRARPETYLRSVVTNCGRLFLPASETGTHRKSHNALILRRWTDLWNLLVAGAVAPRWPGLLVLAGLPLLFGLGVVESLRWLRGWRRRAPGAAPGPGPAAGVTILYMTCTIAYACGLTVLLSAGDQNRYRYELVSFQVALLALLLSRACGRLRRRPRPGVEP